MSTPHAATHPQDLAEIAERFQVFADQVVTRLPLYRRLCTGAAGDPDVCARLLLAAPNQRTPNLLLAAVHDVLLAGALEPLADWYPSVSGRNPSTDARSRPVGRGEDDPWPHFRAMALHHPEVEHLLRTRSTQTNEVGRSATLFPGLYQALVSGSSGLGALRPLSLIEIGSSAGLNLHPGNYGYRYRRAATGGEPEQVLTSVGSSSKLMLDCELRGDLVPPLPEASLPIDDAVGLDVHPLDVTEPLDARWLVACQWPEEQARLARLRAAIALAYEDPPPVRAADAVTELRSYVERVPSHALPVVVSTWVLTYLPIDRQQELIAILDLIGSRRDLAMVFSEQPERVPGIPVPPRPDGGPDGRATALVRIEWRRGDRTITRLADQHPHGKWMEWLGA
ncbi:DUF2332 domain-containing protein [Aquihabitans sp. McL0605]|uniref:DUF2332 domain-containing protein n=1 Tax=Aquihabitans sp. McL0605 TaxID=3415671 RepID=UPI003CEF7CA2